MGAGKGLLSKAKVTIKQVPSVVSKIGKSVGPMARSAAKALRAAKPVLNSLGKVAKPVAVVVGGLDILDAYDKGGVKAAKKQAIITGGSTLGGAAGGAALGAAVGSVVPGIGTAIGGIVGGIVGWMGGEKITRAIVE